MSRRRSFWAAAVAATGLLSMAAAAAPLVPREAIVSLGAVQELFPDVTQEAGTGPNETAVGTPAASRSVVFTSADGSKKVTFSVDRYASPADAAAAFRTAIEGSRAAPGFQPAPAPRLGEEAFAGTSQVGKEMHFGLGAREGVLVVSATHAGDIPVTPENTNKLTQLGRVTLVAAKKVQP